MNRLVSGIAAALRFLILAALIIPQTPLRIIAAAFVVGDADRKAEDRAIEGWRPQQAALVESGQADWCPECEGAGSVRRTREGSSIPIEFWCSVCEGRGLVGRA